MPDSTARCAEGREENGRISLELRSCAWLPALSSGGDAQHSAPRDDAQHIGPTPSIREIVGMRDRT